MVISHLSYIEVVAEAKAIVRLTQKSFSDNTLCFLLLPKHRRKAAGLPVAIHEQQPVDLLIAAHAKSEGIEFLTHHFKDFVKYKELKVHHCKLPS